MKTTIEISDSLLRQVKRYAAANDLTLRQAVESGLRNLMEAASPARKPFRLRDGSFQGKGMIADYSWPEIRGIIYAGNSRDRS